MKPSFLILVAAGLLLAGCGKNNSGPHPQGTNTSQTTNTTDSAHPAAPSGGYLGALMQADKYAVKTIDVSYLNEAVELFHTQEGRLRYGRSIVLTAYRISTRPSSCSTRRKAVCPKT